MKVVSRNYTAKSSVDLPSHNMDEVMVTRVINNITSFIKKSFNEEPIDGDQLIDYRKYARLGIEKFKQTLLGKQIIRDRIVDQYFFDFLESYFGELNYTTLKAV